MAQSSGIHPTRWTATVAATVLALSSPWLCAQTSEPDSFLLRQRQVEDQAGATREADRGPADRAYFDYGGWTSFNLFVFDDGIEQERTLRRYDLRLWTRLRLDEGAHEFYLRSRVSLLDFNSGQAYDGNDDDIEGMNLERGTYRFDLGRWAAARGGPAPTTNLTLALGRDLVEFGTGLALSTPLDHVDLTLHAPSWRLRGLVGRTVGSSQDFDLTRPTLRTRRAIFGGEWTYTGFQRHEPFVYVLWQRDHNREAYPTRLQEYDYDSFYAGIGSRGEIVPKLAYRTEWVYESGHSFGDRAFLDPDVIRAWAFDAELEYLFSGAHRPRASVEYLFGSGDGQRRVSPTDAVGGNFRGAEDNGFVALGYRDTGLALAPRYSNLHTWRAGGSFLPWPGEARLDQLEIGANAFLYFKNHRAGAISDPTATRGSGFVGWEVDAYVNWPIATDLAWTTRVGVFFPGDSFDDRGTRTFFLTGVTWSF